MKDEPVIMFDSPEAAKPYTMTGWLSRDGNFYKDERAARYSGCTHVACPDCGSPARKGRIHCGECASKKDVARYMAMPESDWDGVTMLYSETLDAYFSSPEEAQEEAECICGEGTALSDIRLVICEPNYAREIDEDFFCDELPEDGVAPVNIQEAIDEFNKAVSGTILSWSPGKFRLKLSGVGND